MDISKIISNSIKYPFRNVKRLPILFIPFIMIAIIPIGMKFNNNYVIIFGIFTLLLSVLIIPGYLLSIVLKGSVGSSILPSLSLGKNIYDTIRLWILRIIYMIIPVTAFIVILASFGLTSIDLLFNLQVRGFLLTIILMLVLILLIYVLFEFLLFFAKARLAYFNSLPEALKIHKVLIDIKNLGVVNIIKWFIIMAILMSVFSLISSWVVLIPYVGVLIYLCVVVPIMESISNYSLGLLYSNITEDPDDIVLKEIENDIRRFKYFNFR